MEDFLHNIRNVLVRYAIFATPINNERSIERDETIPCARFISADA